MPRWETKKNLPEPPKFADGWLIGKPDKIIRLEKPYKVQATGTVEYKYFKTPAPFKEDVWVQAAEARPDNRPVVHHIIAFIAPPGKRRRGLGPSVAGFAPGEEPVIYPKGMGFKIPAGYDIWWQMHYTPTGKEEVDQSEVGLIFCKEPPTRAIRGGGVFPDYKKFTIRPGMPSERFSYSRSFNSDIKLLALMPHMHLRGKDFKYILHRPNQKPETILSVPDYDFNWQHRYRFNEPLSVPKGSRLECVAHFDNSADNPANPKPEETVRWGDQTWEEMMIGWYTYVSEKEYVAPKAKLKKENSSEKKAATKRDAADAKTKGKKLKKAQSRQAELPLPRSRQRNGASTTTE